MRTAEHHHHLRKKIKLLLIAFICFLIFSGLTAFPLEAELRWLSQLCCTSESNFCHWITLCFTAVEDVNARYPFLSYGTDWLAFAHIVIAIAFIGPLKNPFRNIWVIEFGMIACVLVIPMALIAGNIRSIPIFWQLIDCSFGIIGILPLWLSHRLIRKLEVIQTI